MRSEPFETETEARAAYWELLETEDLILNLAIRHDALDAEVIREILEARGMSHENGGWMNDDQRSATKDKAERLSLEARGHDTAEIDNRVQDLRGGDQPLHRAECHRAGTDEQLGQTDSPGLPRPGVVVPSV